MESNLTNTVVVVFSANNGYSPYLATTMQSIIANSNDSRQYELITLHTSISAGNREKISSLADGHPNINIRFIDLSKDVKNKKFFVGGKKGLTAETYFRLYIPKVLSDYDKAIYLDCDMVVETDIATLYDTNIDGFLFASSPDYGAIGKYYMGDKAQINYWNNVIKLLNIEEYFCAGMLVMNLVEMRKIGVNTIISLATSNNWEKHDQDVLNILGRGRTKILHPEWDVLKAFDEVQYLPKHIMDKVREAEFDPKIIHFSSSYKPWNTGFIERFDRFWYYAAQTPYFYDMVRNLYTNRPYQCYVLKHFSHDGVINYIPIPNDIMLSYGLEDIYLGRLGGNYAKIEQMRVDDDCVYLRGRTMLMSLEDEDDIAVYVKVNQQSIACDILRGDFSEKKGEVIAYFGVGFTCRIPLAIIAEKGTIEIYCRVKGWDILKSNISFGKFAPLTTKLKKSYYYSKGFVITSNGKSLVVKKCNKRMHDAYEKSLLGEIGTKGEAGKKALLARKLYSIIKPFRKRKIWLFSDRANKADDNGEAMFRYVCASKPKGVRPYYVIDKRSPDYKRMKKIGRVVSSMSWKHKWLYLNCEFNISSQADTNTIYPFQSVTPYYCDLISDIKFVFLQHGVIKEDMSATYNRTNQNMAMFVTAAFPEYRSIVENGQYDCDESITKLTGLPRHDRLYHSEKKVVTLMPTWRKYLFQHSAEYMGVWEPRHNFSESEYFKFYDNLINHPRLIAALKKYGYGLRFMPHPNVHGAVQYFHKNDNVYIYPLNTPYSQIFAESKLVITDRSSAIMDFVYLRKPVVYCLFDDDDFMAGEHVYTKGYFDYEQDGFGRVAYDLETTVDYVIEALKSDCKLDEKYRKRIDKFFAFNDKKNCERVYKEILKLR